MQYSFYGLPVSDISERSVLDFFLNSINIFHSKVIYGYSVYSIYAIKKIPEIYTLGCKADLFLTDGRPFYWLCKLAGIPLGSGISIPECVMMALTFANENHLKVMLVGATLEINEKAFNNLKVKYSQAIFIEGYHGFFIDDEEIQIIKKINIAEPDFLLVGMSSPKKEKFVFNNKSLLKAKIIIPCGGMIDVLAGKTRMTPRWIKRIGLASVFRVIQEPKRLLFDRIKMGWFIFTSFLPRLLAIRITGRSNFSIPDYYIKDNKI